MKETVVRFVRQDIIYKAIISVIKTVTLLLALNVKIKYFFFS